MSTPSPSHLWITGSTRAQSQAGVDLPAPLASVDAHRHHRGPYSAAGALLRAIVPAALATHRDLIVKHDIEILAVAPELAAVVPSTRDTLTSLASPEERTRFYPGPRTLRIAHGLTDLLIALARADGTERRSLLVANADQADDTDIEWLAVLLRRMPPEAVTVVVGTSTIDVPEPLIKPLRRHAMHVEGAAQPRGALDPAATARVFIAGDCTSDDPSWLAAYVALRSEARAALHDLRAAELEALDQPSLRLGAIPLHRERGQDPAGAGVDAMLWAVERCVLAGFYHAVVDMGRRCLTHLDWRAQPDRCWLVVAKVCTALTALGRPDDAALLYEDACAHTTLPTVHLQAAYGRAMLFTRYYDNARVDHQKAKAWINTAIAISTLLKDVERRAFNVTFNENGLALIEMHLGDATEALRLVTDGLRRLDTEIGPDRQTLHRSVLRYNRAQLLARIGDPREAIAEYTKAIDADPHHSEYYLERAALHRRLDQPDQARADYTMAIELSPPYPEPHYNRGELAMESGELDGALDDFDRVIELDPGFVDAYVNRAAVRYQLGDPGAARADIDAGLAIDPDQPHLHCLSGLLAQDAGRSSDAGAAFGRAVELDPTLLAAWNGLGALRFETGDAEGAVACFDRAIALQDDPAVRANRALALQQAARWLEAVADYDVLLGTDALDPVERAEIVAERSRCLDTSANLAASGTR